MIARDAPPGPSPMTGGRHVVVVAAGDVPSRDALDRAWPGWADGVDAVVAADGGLGAADALGLAPTRGRRRPGLRRGRARRGRRGCGRAGHPDARPDKDESDTELAVLEAVRLGATRITVLGALGGPRLDHELANVWLLALDALGGVPTALLDERVRVTLLVAPASGEQGGRRATGAARCRRRDGLAAAVRRRRPGRDHAGPALPAGRRAAHRRSRARPVQRSHRCGRRRDHPARPPSHHRVGDMSREAARAAGGLSSTA